MATTLEIINGISQAIANTHDGALDENGEPIKIGLRREEVENLTDERVMDGFGACVYGNRLHIKYHSEVPLSEVHESSFESEIDRIVGKVKSYIQKEYKKVVGSSVSMTDPSEIDIFVEYISRKRASVKAKKCWKLSGVDSSADLYSKDFDDPVANATRSWIEQSRKGKKPKNVKIKT
tara:strand:- start:3120 stop:3653 length:534 start_codon:yes stop_codon:yes gene_type:complete